MSKKKSTQKRYVKVVRDPIYRYLWIFIYGGKLNDAIKYYALRTQVEPWTRDRPGDAHFGAHADTHAGFIWMKDRCESHGLIAHECFHATLYMFEHIGMTNINEHNEEAFAYSLQWLVNELENFCDN